MAGLCGVPADAIHPDERMRALMDLPFDNGFLDDFVLALEDRWNGPIPETPCPESLTSGPFIKVLALSFQPFEHLVLRLDPRRLTNPALDIRHALPDLLAERSGGSIRDDGYGYAADRTALLLFLRTDRLDAALACMVGVIETAPVYDNDLRPAVVAVQRPGGFEVVYPRGFEGPFSGEVDRWSRS
jgi:hypothetical protein